MLRHPFFGVIGPPDEPADDERWEQPQEVEAARANDARPTARRTFFAQALGSLVGAGALLLLGKRAEAQDGFRPGGAAGGSFDKGFSGQAGGSFRGGLGGDAFGDPGPRYHNGGGTVTTYAIGEEGSGGTVTTYAIGEEGSSGPVTTYATGEEGSWATTYALGEEGSYRPPYRRYYYYGNPYYRYRRNRRYTTYALGEEGRW